MKANHAALPSTLTRILKDLPKIALAFSGGLDSRFLAHAALLCGCEVTAFSARGPHIATEESHYARSWAQKRGLEFISFYFDPLEIPQVRHNSRERCYGCKKAMFAEIACHVDTHMSPIICDGSNADDLEEFRPGLQAISEAGVISPLAQADLGKQEIRALAAASGLDFPDQKSRPCLLTRLNYGLTPDRDDLARISDCENALKRILAAYDYNENMDFRLRLLPRPVLQTNRTPGRLEIALTEILARYGFGSAEIIVTDRISGFFDKANWRW